MNLALLPKSSDSTAKHLYTLILSRAKMVKNDIEIATKVIFFQLFRKLLFISICIYQVECSLMVREIGVQSQVES